MTDVSRGIKDAAKKAGKEKTEDKIKVIPISGAIFENELVEQVWLEGRPAFQIHTFKGSKPDIIIGYIESKDELGNPIEYVPIDNELLRKGSVWIPEAEKNIEAATFSKLWESQDKLLDLAFDAVKQREEARLFMRICTSSWFVDKEETGIAGVGKFAPILAIRGLSGGGKNRFTFCLRCCSYHPFYQSSTNKIPSIFRPLELWKGALVLNEADIDPNGKDRELAGLLIARSYGDAISRQNPNNINEANAFNQFQLTIVTQRENFGENALEGRSIPFYTEKSWNKLPSLETPEMIELGKEIQKVSLALRMKYYSTLEINKAFWLDTSDARLNSALLPLAALSNIDPSISELLNKQLRKLERRKTQLKAESDDGLLTNFLFNKLQQEDGEMPLFEHYQGNAYYFLDKHEIHTEKRFNEHTKETSEIEEEIRTILTTSNLQMSLGFNSSKGVRKKLDALLHTEDLPVTYRPLWNTHKVAKPVWFRIEPLTKLFREFVIDFDPEKHIPEALKPKAATLDSQDGRA